MRKNDGFTLLELLVVIGIISILMALGAISYTLAQSKGRDSRRVSDMKAIQAALEQYYTDNNYSYPTTCSNASSFILGSWPTDPINGAVGGVSYVYGSGTCTANSYCYCARLEKAGGNSSVNDCSNWSNNGDYFCVGNLQ